MSRSDTLDNANPQIYKCLKEREVIADDQNEDVVDCFDSREIFDLVRDINDPEHPLTLEELNVVDEPNINVDDAKKFVIVAFTPTIPHCSMATLIGLAIRVKLLRSHPSRFKDTVNRLKLQCKDLLSKNEVDCKFYTNLQMKCSELSSRVESFATACDEKQLKITALEDEMKKCKPLQCECKLQPIPHFKKRIVQLEQCEERYKSQIRRLQAQIAEPTVPLRRPSEDKSLTATSTTYECSSYGSGTVNSVILMEMKEKEARLEAKMKKLAKNNDQLKAKLQQYMERMENMKRVVESTPASISSVKSCLQLGPLSYEATSSMDNTARYFESTLRTPAVKKERDITDFEVLENSPPKRSRLPETEVSNLNETTKVTLSPSSREMYERCDVQ